MHTRSGTRRWRARRWLGMALVGALAVAAGCGDDDDSSSGTQAPTTAASSATTGSAGSTTSAGSTGSTSASSTSSGTTTGGSDCVASAEKYLADYKELPTALPASFTPLKAKPEAGGTIIKIVNGTIPSDGKSADTQAAAAKAIGWTAKSLVHDGSVEDLNAKWQQAISEKPTAITGSGFPAAVLQQRIDEAKAAGIVVSLANTADDPQSYPGFAASANSTPVAKLIGTIHANMVMRESGCDAHIAVFTLPFPILKVATDEFRKVLTDNCEKCTVTETEIQPADIGSPAATTAMVSQLQSDPSVKYAYTVIANLATGLTAALDQANIEGVKVFGQVPDENAIKELQKGTQAWWVTQSSEINGWMELDAVLRAIEAKQPFSQPGNPLGVLTPDNVPANATTVPIYPANYQDLFKKIWLVA